MDIFVPVCCLLLVIALDPNTSSLVWSTTATQAPDEPRGKNAKLAYSVMANEESERNSKPSVQHRKKKNRRKKISAQIRLVAFC